MEYTIDLIKKDIERNEILLKVNMTDEFTETYIKRIESLNKALLILNGVVLSACSFYVSGNDTSANCINCGKPHHMH